MNDDRKLADIARARLDESVADLDPRIGARLAAARANALAAPRRRPQRLYAGLALAASVALALVVVGRGDPTPAELEPIEILAANEPLELYQELDFYLWLEDELTGAPAASG